MEDPKIKVFPKTRQPGAGRDNNGPAFDSERPEYIPYTVSIEANRQEAETREERLSGFCPKVQVDPGKALENINSQDHKVCENNNDKEI